MASPGSIINFVVISETPNAKKKRKENDLAGKAVRKRSEKFRQAAKHTHTYLSFSVFYVLIITFCTLIQSINIY